ncbi:fimbrial protein [Pseudomonas sp. B21-012]|uniref:fimbrial protein n=1 Tax=Pseudomonas sp. B21-012 TaxID=2895472 RepID=UPI00215E8EFD|nr:fimbrial protein [Pseudomonas sp. B21-012]UVM58466.1 fimbrial protein [Pseudomonas sp. B21-012]
MTKFKKIAHIRVPLLVAACAMSLAGSANADQRLMVKGVIIATVCKISEGQLITGAFGDVRTDLIDGSYKAVELNYAIVCASNKSVKMRVEGTAASFDESILAIPTFDNVGIAFKRSEQQWPINTWYSFNSSAPPTLHAVLVKVPGSRLKLGSFSTGATLVLEYQ